MRYLRPITVGLVLLLLAALVVLSLVVYQWKQPQQGIVYLKPNIAPGQDFRDGLVTKSEKYIAVRTNEHGEELFTWDQIRYISIKNSSSSDRIVDIIDLLSKLAFAVTIALFVIGLYQYRQAQKWKREEFLVAAVKDFGESKSVRNAMQMLDSLALFKDGRKIELFPQAETFEKQRVFVKNEEIYKALTTNPQHDLARDDDRAVVIRECFDAFLSELVTFYHYVEQHLITKEALNANIGYWIELLGPDSDLRADYQRRIFAYAEKYGLIEVEDLIRNYHEDFRWKTSIPQMVVLRHFKSNN